MTAKKGKRRKITAVIAVFFLMAFCCAASGSEHAAEETAQDTASSAQISSLADIEGKKLGMINDSSYVDYALEELKPSEALYYNSFSDMLEALRSGRIDALLHKRSTLEEMAKEVDDITILPEALTAPEVALMLPKSDQGEELCSQVNAYLAELSESGELEELKKTWLESDTSENGAVDLNSLTGENGAIIYATDLTCTPYDYMDNEGYKGYEIALVYGFCQEYGYRLKISSTDANGVFSAVATGRADIGGRCANITEERKKSVLFTDQICTSDVVAAVRSVEKASSTGFLASLQENFEKTFVRESRWKLIVSGLWVTMELAVLSAFFGTFFGFLLYFARSGKNWLARGLSGALLEIVQGVPILVILMVLYYIVFASARFSGTTVAVVSFTITFGCSVAGILLGCIGAVDRGQWEAAAALGFEEGTTFGRLILPQAMYQILPMYKSSFISMMKGTSVVGYIAVQDLTKASDIVRSRTYEAFFPLISTAVIYFILSWLITRALGLVEVRLDPKRRRGRVLKGIDTGRASIADKTQGENPFAGNRGEELARFEHMEKKYDNGGVPLKDVNAVIRRGDVVTIIGPSGTGKSTLMRCLNRLEQHTKGEVIAFGKPVPTDKKELCRMRQRMGMVFQSFNLFPHLTVIENVMFSQIRLKGRSRQEAYDYGIRLLRTVGMAEKALSYPDELSGGQKQRVAIARTLAMDPEMILFDEPTSALDPTMVGQVLSVIRELAKRGLTMMIVTHEMKFARDVSTRIFYMDQGVIYEEGSPEEVFDHPQRNRTRVFVQRLKVERVEITSHDYDYFEVQDTLQRFGEKSLMTRKQVTALRRCFEELCEKNILPRLPETFDLKIYLEYSEEKGQAYLRMSYDGPAYNPLEEAQDELAMSLVKASVLESSYFLEDGRNRIHLTI